MKFFYQSLEIMHHLLAFFRNFSIYFFSNKATFSEVYQKCACFFLLLQCMISLGQLLLFSLFLIYVSVLYLLVL